MLANGTEGCNYLLSVDVDMNTVPGYAMSSWEKGYGDMIFDLDLDTIRLLPHLPGSVMIQSRPDLAGRQAGQPVAAVHAKAQQARAAALGFTAFAGTELEFIVFNNTYEEAWDADYKGLTPANQYNVDYSILGTTRIEPLLRDIRNTMYAAGLTVESAKGECNLGQHEIAFRFEEVLTTADNHVGLQEHRQGDRRAARPRADLHGQVQRAGGQFLPHPPVAARHRRRAGVLGSTAGTQRTPLYDHFIAGILATMREFTLLYAPNINSYKRFADGSFAPTTVAWGLDNRTCSVRLVGHGPSARLENRLPGGDVNPYLAIAAMLAGGLYGVENELPLEDELVGNAYTSGKPTVPDHPAGRPRPVRRVVDRQGGVRR